MLQLLLCKGPPAMLPSAAAAAAAAAAAIASLSGFNEAVIVRRANPHVDEQEDVGPDALLLNGLSLAGAAGVAVKQPAALLHIIAAQPAVIAAAASSR
jgi:hypothetical protein